MFLFSKLYVEMLIRLVVATILGGVIGFERAEKNHDAGLRTHILVCLGSAAVMVMSQLVCQQYIHLNLDVTRMGAQVISGIGFLGAGCIITDGNKAKGLTTAAGLWTTSCVGLVIGIGYYTIAVTIVALMMFAMLGLRPLADKLHSKSFDITISFLLNDQSKIEELMKYIKNFEMEILSVKIEEKESGITYLIMETHGNRKFSQEDLLCKIGSLKGVKGISFS